MFNDEINALLANNLHLITISSFGGIVLFGLKVTEYINRSPEDQMPILKAVVLYFLLLLVLPLLGAAVSAIYIINGDKISAVLAFQVGLTSPAIVQSMVIAAANRAKQEPVTVNPDA